MNVKTMNLEVSYTQDLPLNDSNHNLDTPKCGLWKGLYLGSHYVSFYLEVEDKVPLKFVETLAFMEVFIEFLQGLSDLSPPTNWLT